MNTERRSQKIKEKIARKASCQSPMDLGQCHDDTDPQCMTQVTSGCLRKIKRPQRHAITHMLPPSMKMGVSCHGVHKSLTACAAWTSLPKRYKLSVWIPACSGNQLFCRQKGSPVFQKQRNEHLKSLSTSSCAQKNIPVSRWVTSMPHAGGTPLRMREQLRVRQVVLSSQHVCKDIELLTARNPQEPKRLSRGRRCMFSEKKRTSSSAKCQR